ncbi:MAG: hypothetical protein C4K58_00370 [Flavobacteriaceae bacterium]|nr:MAG: hypothetical protein C4K58_00370 [Flavobacteriaceae bacterium]
MNIRLTRILTINFCILIQYFKLKIVENFKDISKNYSKMSDEQLLKLWNEKYKLRNEIVPILKLELEKRKIEFEESIDISKQSVENKTSMLNLINKNIEKENNFKKNVIANIEYYIERNQSKNFIIKKVSDEHNIGSEYIENIFSELRRKSRKTILLGLFFLIPTIIRLIILTNTNYNYSYSPPLLPDLLYFLIFAAISFYLLFKGIRIRKKYK